MTYQVLKNWLFSAIRLEIKDFTAKLNLVECPLTNTALPYTSPDAAVCCLDNALSN
ncbi:hypothetical protein [Nostoc sphaeroides]|uniref:Uncharacterized protein n=1 Tax=Nostoc sphaeroides CCNUC1 TaxID=2653204 RepID=A0A5P8WGT8_9NOSO|nr:hypothetical protein [Nostoc sphaeroides]QFS51732.1 hypothetical protein GXM_09226 [Nostoc sphaeroides CCNUC1]